MKKAGHSIEIVYVCGGLRKNSLYVETHADVLGKTFSTCYEEIIKDKTSYYGK